MKNIRYTIADPSGNITLLVDASGSGIPFSETKTEAGRAGLADLGRILMEAEPTAQQMGFVFRSESFLYMGGGEFCGNAALCAAAFMWESNGLAEGKNSETELRVSGNSEICRIYAEKISRGFFRCTLKLSSKPDGIKHFVLYRNIPLSPCEEAEAQSEIREISKRNENASCGLIFIDEAGCGTGEYKMRPLVYVPALGSLFWESSCASGSMAAAEDICRRNAALTGKSIRLSQPGGVITVKLHEDGGLELTNTVALSEEKLLCI